ncbi:putative Thylakoid lumenal 29.8 kDa protein, chloroplast precursor [Hibiscus syriacus]|uniref:Thylakoid lumenal 29.8 kDa protein, chloroplast n=1 Tax=Hibiscus syriacus TaxID=106335 RepID=A0A6A3C130_HIBSY|nr:putative Thylakoid lumenal 29.8 kDa protein, chloroplast precursor [Hibiscus syriacus]
MPAMKRLRLEEEEEQHGLFKAFIRKWKGTQRGRCLKENPEYSKSGVIKRGPHWILSGAVVLLLITWDQLEAADQLRIRFMHGISKMLASEAFRMLMVEQGQSSNMPLVIVIDDLDSPTSVRLGELEYEELIHNGNPGFVPVEVHDEWDPIALNYTSGTTTEPKGVVYSHRGAYLSTLSLILGWEMRNETVYLWSLPMFH